MIVDDSQLIIDRLIGMLDELDENHLVFTAGNYADAVTLVAEKKPDITFLDIHLPGKNGIALLKHIGENYPHIQNIMLSNEGSSFYRKLCKESGAVHFIDKSKEFELITEIIASMY